MQTKCPNLEHSHIQAVFKKIRHILVNILSPLTPLSLDMWPTTTIEGWFVWMKTHLICAASEMHYMYNFILDNFKVNMVHAMLLINFTFHHRQGKTETLSNHVTKITHRLLLKFNTFRCFKVFNPSQLIDPFDNLFVLRFSIYNICIVANNVKCCLVRLKKMNERDN